MRGADWADRCFEPKILTRLSKHYKTGEILDEDFINKILKRSVGDVVVPGVAGR